MPGNGHIKDKKRVMVVDANKQFVEYITSAAARKYIREKSVNMETITISVDVATRN